MALGLGTTIRRSPSIMSSVIMSRSWYTSRDHKSEPHWAITRSQPKLARRLTNTGDETKTENINHADKCHDHFVTRVIIQIKTYTHIDCNNCKKLNTWVVPEYMNIQRPISAKKTKGVLSVRHIVQQVPEHAQFTKNTNSRKLCMYRYLVTI